MRATGREARVAFAVVCLLLAGGSVAVAAGMPTQDRYLGLAAAGVAQTQSHFYVARRGWYVERLNDRALHPLATIWGSVPLFESITALDMTQPTVARRRAVDRFAHGAERCFDRAIGGYAPYPGDRGVAKAWFDDNGWWGLAFVDAYRATGEARYLRDADRALSFALAAGWDQRAGGLWWNTGHPYKSGEALAANSWLAAQLYRLTHRLRYEAAARQLMDWGRTALWDARDGLYARSDRDPTPMPYVEGPMIAAEDALCQAGGAPTSCTASQALAAESLKRFRALSMGPQFDVIYLRALLYTYADTHDARLYEVAQANAEEALGHAGDHSGLYLRAWDGSSMASHQASAKMLRTHAATVSLLAALAATRPPG